MLAAVVSLAGVVLVLAAVVLALVVVRRPEGRLRGRSVIVQTQDGQALRGIVHAEHADRLSLVDASSIDGRAELPIAGVAHVPATNIAWIQEVTS
jgi:hypothetical protein